MSVPLLATAAFGAMVAGGVLLILVAAAAFAILLLFAIRRRGMNLWIGTYVRERHERAPPDPQHDVHLLFCIADHYEPRHGDVGAERAMQRVHAWVQQYPLLFDCFRDSDGRPPRHTFFYPLEEYDSAEIDALAGLCRQGYGEVEVHLHHDNDNPENLRRRLLAYKNLLAERHGMLCRRRDNGQLAYGFVHGNWALDNSRPDGRWCGVNCELDILRETGCYADFTMPSAPSQTQTRKINSIYYACDDPVRPKSHDWGVDVGVEPQPANSLVMVQGPLLLDWQRRRMGLIPRIENGCIQGNQAPTAARLDLWLKARIQVPTRPDWYFVKVYTHGAPEDNARVLLGEPMVRFHQALAARAQKDPRFHFHYLSAREMYNLVRAAAVNWQGSVNDARDQELIWNAASPGV
jgi:hypothetical protein